jgi:hypothetical protein
VVVIVVADTGIGSVGGGPNVVGDAVTFVVMFAPGADVGDLGPESEPQLAVRSTKAAGISHRASRSGCDIEVPCVNGGGWYASGGPAADRSRGLASEHEIRGIVPTGVAVMSSQPNEHRATGASLAVIILVSAAFSAVTVIHMLRTDLDPVREVMSAYANGSHGVVMTAAFYALGIAALLMSYRLPKATHHSIVARSVAVLLAASGVGLVLAGVFEVERPLVPDTIEEIIHSDAAIGAFVLLIGAMVLFAVVCRRDVRWHTFFGPGLTLAAIAVIGAGLSPVADRTPWTGLAQRTLGLTVFTWLLLVAVRIRFHPAHQPPAPVMDAP